VFRSHDAVRAAVGFAGDDSDFRDSSFGEAKSNLAVLDDSSEFLLGSAGETGNIFER